MKLRSATVSCMLLCLAAAPAHAAFDYFLKLEGIDGGSTVKGYEKWIEVDSYLFDVANITSGSGGGGTSSRITFQDFSFNKEVDLASARIFEYLVTGKNIESAKFEVVQTDGKIADRLITYAFSDVLFTSFVNTGAEPNRPTESVAFRFDQIELTTYTQDPKGGISKPGASIKWDLKKNAVADAVPTSPVPEPSTWLTLAAGLLIVAGGSRIARLRRQSGPPA